MFTRRRTKRKSAGLKKLQRSPLSLIRSTGVTVGASVIDIGGGTSRLVDALINEGFETVTVLDISEKALAIAKARLGVARRQSAMGGGGRDEMGSIGYLRRLARPCGLSFPDRSGGSCCLCRAQVHKAVRPGGHVIIGTFAPDGPERCSGLQVVRHDAASLGQMLGSEFELVETWRHFHRTPTGALQPFSFCRFQRRTGSLVRLNATIVKVARHASASPL